MCAGSTAKGKQEMNIDPQPAQKKCQECQKSFLTYNGSHVCYDCTLVALTNGAPPEEGDFNTAAIRAGTMSPSQRRQLLRELESVEQGVTTAEELDEQDGWREESDYWDQAEADRYSEE